MVDDHASNAYLAPYGSAETYEQRVEVHIHPPRSPAAEARAWPFEVVGALACLRQRGRIRAGKRHVRPFHEVATELRPERASGRLKARFRLIVRNKANARTEVSLSAEDEDGECKFRWAQPKIALEPGNALECPFTVFPPKQIWIGRAPRTAARGERDAGRGRPAAPPRQVVFRQRAWLPWWLAVVAVAAIATAVVLIKLLPKPVAVPNLKGQPSMFAAEQVANKSGFKVASRPRR